ncbi:hypothetical protein ACQ859_17940 [Roseateles chitinivorans]|uniref:hypothetical protein n=1 Tax=Roseateles chitinivorans TaxID=2917965 RepID=UPI003D66B411
MKLDRARQGAEAQQAREAQEAAGKGQARGSGSSGYAGGMHKGNAYRHAPRAQVPARRNTGPAPRPRPRPPSNGAQGAHHEDEHPQMPMDDPRQMAAGGAGANTMRPVQGTGGRQQKPDAGERQEKGSLSSPPRARMPPPPPEVREGAALRRSALPAAVMLRATPTPEGKPPAVLLDALASLYFKGGGAGVAAGAMRLAAMTAVARHLPAEAAPSLSVVKAAAVAWCAANGPPPSATDAQKNANLLFPLNGLRALFRPLDALRDGAEVRSSQLQRALTQLPSAEAFLKKDPQT